MKLFYKFISDSLSRKPKSGDQDSNIPNGWGRQKYLGRFQNVVYNDQIDLNNITEKKGWIQGYAAKKILGIKSNHSKNWFFYPYHRIKYTK